MGTSIMNAKIGIRNYGFDAYEKAGGMIHCQETDFVNNTIGVEFAPYQNFSLTGKPMRSLGSFRNCDFITDENYYLNEPFYAFANLFKADGMNFTGCKFVNTLLPELPSGIEDFGFGIHSVSAGFGVYAATSVEETVPCFYPCIVYDSTTFDGLGLGIFVSTIDKNRPYSVYQANFNNCYRGITDISTGGGTILFNKFSFGNVPGSFSAGQIGIDLHFDHNGFALQENSFELVNEESKLVTIGILSNGLGEFDNEIRRNTFTGIEIANQAFGVNADLTLDVERGLLYSCNTQEETTSYGYDFHIPNTPAPDLIHPFQTPGSSLGSNISVGNKFAYTAHDFMNLGEGGISYWYYPQGQNEEPRDSFSVGINPLEGILNSCAITYCAPPCIEDIQDAKDDYFINVDLYDTVVLIYLQDAITENSQKMDSSRSMAIYNRRAASKSVYDVITHMMIDTVSYHIDSLITWLGYLDTYGGELMVAGEYSSSLDFVSALDILETISMRRAISSTQQSDIDNVIALYKLLDEKGIASLNSQDRTTLRNIAYSNIGMSSGVARALLSYFHEYIPLPYYQGQQIKFRSEEEEFSEENKTAFDIPVLRIYPNPAGDFATIVWNEKFFQPEQIEVFNMFGHKVTGIGNLIKASININISNWNNGLYLIIARDNSGKIISSKLIKQSN